MTLTDRLRTLWPGDWQPAEDFPRETTAVYLSERMAFGVPSQSGPVTASGARLGDVFVVSLVGTYRVRNIVQIGDVVHVGGSTDSLGDLLGKALLATRDVRALVSGVTP